jgi:hypothetical protein
VIALPLTAAKECRLLPQHLHGIQRVVPVEAADDVDVAIHHDDAGCLAGPGPRA